MRNTMVVFIALLTIAVLLVGCAPTQEEVISDESFYQPPVLREEVVKEPEPKSVEVVEDVEEIGEVEEIVDEEKQIATGGTTIKEEDLSLLSDVNCTFVDDEGENVPYGFSFAFANTEEKEWIFAPLSYGEREKFENPIITVNALQVTNGQLVDACGESRFKEGESAFCEFDLNDVSNTILRKSLRKGETAAGNPQLNTISLRTSGHAAEIKFFCE